MSDCYERKRWKFHQALLDNDFTYASKKAIQKFIGGGYMENVLYRTDGVIAAENTIYFQDLLVTYYYCHMAQEVLNNNPNVDLIKFLLTFDLDQDSKRMFLWVAIQDNVLPIVQAVVDSGFDYKDDYVRALSAAADYDNLEMVKYFLKIGSDVNECSGQPLTETVYQNNLKIAQYLLSQGATVMPDHMEDAAELGHLEMLKLLAAH